MSGRQGEEKCLSLQTQRGRGKIRGRVGQMVDFPLFFQSGWQGHWTLLLDVVGFILGELFPFAPCPSWKCWSTILNRAECPLSISLSGKKILQIAGTAKFGSRKFVENNFRQLAGFKTIFLSYKFIFAKFPGPRRNFAKKNSSKSSRLFPPWFWGYPCIKVISSTPATTTLITP